MSAYDALQLLVWVDLLLLVVIVDVANHMVTVIAMSLF